MKINKYKVAGVMTIFLLIVTPWINKIVNIVFRSSAQDKISFGSECLLWLFPIMIIGLVDAVSREKDNSI